MWFDGRRMSGKTQKNMKSRQLLPKENAHKNENLHQTYFYCKKILSLEYTIGGHQMTDVGVPGVGDEVPLEPQALQQLGLQFGTRLGNGQQSVCPRA